MYKYYIFSILFLIILIIRKKNISYILILLLLSYIGISYAGLIGTDVSSYKLAYERPDFIEFEPLFSFLIKASKFLGLDFFEFSSAVAILQVLILVYIGYSIKSPSFIVTYYFIFFYHFEFNAIRNGISLLFFGLFIISKYHKNRFIFLLISIGLHYSALLNYIINYINNFKGKFISYLIFILFIFIYFYSNQIISIIEGFININNTYFDHLRMDVNFKSFYPVVVVKMLIILYIFSMIKNYALTSLAFILFLMIHIYNPLLIRIFDIILFIILLNFFRKKSDDLIIIAFALLVNIAFILNVSSDCNGDSLQNWCI